MRAYGTWPRLLIYITHKADFTLAQSGSHSLRYLLSGFSKESLPTPVLEVSQDHLHQNRLAREGPSHQTLEGQPGTDRQCHLMVEVQPDLFWA